MPQLLRATLMQQSKYKPSKSGFSCFVSKLAQSSWSLPVELALFLSPHQPHFMRTLQMAKTGAVDPEQKYNKIS